MTPQIALAAHRFGLGEASLQTIGGSPEDWLLRQIGPADAALGSGLLDTAGALAHQQAERKSRQLAKNPPPGMPPPALQDKHHFREVMLADVRSRLSTAIQTQRPFAERLFQFWANHFTVSVTKGSARGLAGVFEREAIRPHIAGSFEQLLWASTTHPAMLRYLDNQQSAGPRSQAVARAARHADRTPDPTDVPRLTGLNENLAREVLELHTLGVENARLPQGYTQTDVTSLAKILTGWRLSERHRGGLNEPFDPAWHEPGSKTVLGRSYPEGSSALRLVLRDLAHHPSTARFIAWKLARHFVADTPPEGLVQRLSRSFIESGGQLSEVYRTLVMSPEAWAPARMKLKTPEEFLVSTARLLKHDGNAMLLPTSGTASGPLLSALNDLKQRPHTAASPAGWSDVADDWLGPEAVWKRIEWSTRLADRLGRSVDARALARQALGAGLSDTTQQQIERAADGSQALALLLMSPEMQRR